MDFKKKKKGMVFHQEGATTPVAASAGDDPSARFLVLKPGKASEGGMEQNICETNEEAVMMSKTNMCPSKEATRTFAGLPAIKHLSSNSQSDNLSPDRVCKGIRVTLDNNNMWNEFFRCKTEMILTKEGSRMFPYCRFRISGLLPSQKYSLIMDIQPLDNSCYKWTGKTWQVAGKAEYLVKSQPFAHPESPSTGQHWMQNPVSFYKLKLTSNITDQEGNTILNPMHRYLPQLHVVQTENDPKDIKLNGPNVVTFTFQQTEFMAVTAYQNSQFAQLKIDYNPFAKGLKEDGFTSKGLKLKLNHGKDSHKDGGMTSNEQHPLRKSLKSLLANHKPRSLKALDSKPLVSIDLQKRSTTSGEQSAAKVTEENTGDPHPPPKLFSELMREAHVSLQRCNLEQLGDNNSASHRTEQTNTKTTTLKSSVQDFPLREGLSIKTYSKTPSAKKSETVGKRVKCNENQDLWNSVNCKDIARTDCSEVNSVAALAVSQNSSVDSNGHQHKPETQSQINVKQHKRPAPLPLPALALFLKQHSTKSKKAKSKPNSSPSSVPLESPSGLLSSTAASACLPSDHTTNATGCLKDLTDDVTKSYNHISGRTDVHLHLDEMGCNINGQSVDITHQSSSQSCPDEVATAVTKGQRPDGSLASISVAESTAPDSAVPDGAPVLPSSDQPFCTLGTSISKVSSTLTTSSQSHILSPHFDTVLPPPNSRHTTIISESSSLHSDSHSMQSDSLLPDPECSSLDFEPLSPASSPIPSPSVTPSLALQLDSVASEPSEKSGHPEELPSTEVSASSVFKWHTVLPPPERYIDDSFTTFQPPPQSLPLAPDMSHLLPIQTPSHPEPQNFNTSTSAQSPDLTPSYQENEQSLPFPAELSPLALQLSLSPTFSSLDGDALSPTPSLTDLVHFFSTDDLGIGMDFSNTETVCPPPSTVEGNAHEISQQVLSVPASKPSKRKKRINRQRDLGKTDVDQKMDFSAYTRMQPNLEEVEEQLFISFTSKEALELHVVDSPEEMVPQPQTTPEGHLQQTTDAPENDKSVDVGGNPLPDSIHPNNFPAKLWRLVNDPENKAISWGSGDNVIIDKQLCERQILSPSSNNSEDDVFKTTNFSSFLRQLNLYGFRKVDPVIKDSHQPTGDRIYRHFCCPNFKRNHPELVANMRRLTVDNKAKLQAGLNVGCRTPRQHQRFVGGHDGRDRNVKRETAGSLEEKIAAFDKILLRDLKLMKHRQVIHPVLQEVGLKMNLLDPSLAIDLRYLGVRLPIPPPGVSLAPQTQELPPSQGVCSAFVSRTGKTTDVTQIKGWREKFSPSEAPSTPTPPKPEACPSSDLPKKNLSAFCSDMLDEYLENEGKLIDERAASFSHPVVEPVVYELPTRSTSYVRTLDNVLKKQPDSSPAADLISAFVPPSKRPKLTINVKKMSRRENVKQKGPKQRKHRAEPAAVLSPGESKPVSKQPGVQVPDSLSTEPPTINKRKKLKPKILSQTLGPSKASAPPPGISEETAPLESDSELATTNDQNAEACRKAGGQVMTRALLKQKDLEDGVVWEGKHRTSITEERANIALTSLFTLMGFVRENPTAPIQLTQRQAPPCLNAFCRLGCVCSSLSYCSRISHCGRPSCMLGCSCLKQKVVLLKNLDGSDSSPSQHGSSKKKKRKRRMKMAYILKEADSVSQPAERVRTLWKRDGRDCDPDPIHVPHSASLTRPTVRTQERKVVHSSCARVRAYKGKRKTQRQKKKESLTDVKSTSTRQKSVKQRLQTPIETKAKPSSHPPVGESVKPPPSNQPPSTQAGPPPKPSKRLIILAECKWTNDPKQSNVLKELCEKMARDELDKPFWISKYLITPVSQTLDEIDTNPCLLYKVHISCPKLEREKPAVPTKPPQKEKGRETNPQQDHQQQVAKEEPVEDWQREVEDEEAEPPEDWQREVEDEEAEPPEDWQREVEDEEAELPEDWQREVEDEEADPPEDWQREVEEEEVEPPEDWQKEVDEEADPAEEWQKEVGDEEAEPLEPWQREVEDEEAELPEDWQKEFDEEAEPLEGWQREVVEEEAKPPEDKQREVLECDIKEEAVSTVNQMHDGREWRREESKPRLKKNEMASMALPFLTGISPAGFLSANKKQPGGTDPLIRVNGKLYPLAKIQLGKMGALHPANRLAAYLTGRVGSNMKQHGPSSSSSSSSLSQPPQNQTSQPIPKKATLAPKPQAALRLLTIPNSSKVVQSAAVKIDQSVASSDQPATEPPEGAGSRVVMVKVLPCPKGGANQVKVVPQASGSSGPMPATQVSRSVVPPGTMSPKGSQLFMIPVPGRPGNAPAPAPAPCPPPSISTGQRLVLQHIKAGVQYYRKPDGQLFQLVPINPLRPVNPNKCVQRGSSFASAPPAACGQTPVITVVNPTPPVTAPTSSSSYLSGLPSSTVPFLPSANLPSSAPAQKGTCNIKIVPSNSSKAPIIVTCAKVPTSPVISVAKAPSSVTIAQLQPPVTPVNLISLKPSIGQVAEFGVKMVKVSSAPVNPGGGLAHQRPSSTETTTIQNPAETPDKAATPPPAPPGLEVSPTHTLDPPTGRISPEPELARDLVNLGINCEDDKMGHPAMETVVLDVSSETDNSSDLRDEDNEDEKELTIINGRERVLHNELTKQHRARIQELFKGLRTEVGLNEDKMTEVSTLQKAVQVIQELTMTENDLKKKKRRLRKRRDDFLNVIAPPKEESRQVSRIRQRSPESKTGSGDSDHVEVVEEADDFLDSSSDEEKIINKQCPSDTGFPEDNREPLRHFTRAAHWGICGKDMQKHDALLSQPLNLYQQQGRPIRSHLMETASIIDGSLSCVSTTTLQLTESTQSEENNVPTTIGKARGPLAMLMEEMEQEQQSGPDGTTADISAAVINCGDWLAVIYDLSWWLAKTIAVDAHHQDIQVEIFHPHGPNKHFHPRPGGKGVCFVPIEDILVKLTASSLRGRISSTEEIYHLSTEAMEFIEEEFINRLLPGKA